MHAASVHSYLWLAILAVAIAFLVLVQAEEQVQQKTYVVKHKKGAVATDEELCSQEGVNILMRGGNAVDAAVTTALCLGVVGTGSTGIGAGSFIMIRMANGTVMVIDARETAPSGATEEFYKKNADLKFNGPLSIAVPGKVAGLHKAWDEFGSKKEGLLWKDLLQPAIELAKDFEISKYVANQLKIVRDDILKDQGLREMFTDPNNKDELLKAGDRTSNLQLSVTMQVIAYWGPDAFYKQAIGDILVKDIEDYCYQYYNKEEEKGYCNLRLKKADLEAYQPKVRDPIRGKVMDLEIFTMPPPSSGGASVMLMLKLLEKLEISKGPSTTLERHRFIEAMKHTYAIRLNLGDSDFKPNVTKVVDDMLSENFAKLLSKNITGTNVTNHNPSYYGDRWSPNHEHGTSHFSIIDEEGNAVAMTTSLNWHFGSRFLSRGTGILLNNQMGDFSFPDDGLLPPMPSNYVTAGKRPMSSMSPTIILDKEGKLKAVIGASGGPLIIVAVTQVILNHFWKGLSELDSVESPRLYHYEMIPKDEVYYEDFETINGDDNIKENSTLLEDLAKRGHMMKLWDGECGSCQFITRDVNTRYLTAVSDPRKGGYPAGYDAMDVDLQTMSPHQPNIAQAV